MLVPTLAVAIVLFTVGVAVFARRDLGVTTRIPWPKMPAVALGLGGPFSRSFGERLPLAFWWGLGLGLMGFIFGAAARSFAETLNQLSSETLAIFQAIFPSIDLTSGAGAFLQLAYLTFGLILAGFAASTLVKGWASDETEGRLEMLLATPMSRVRWAIHGGLGLFAAIGAFTVLVSGGIALGSAMTGGDVATPILGSLVIGLYALALAGIGLAIGGVFSTSFAGEVVALIVIVSFLLDIVVPALKLPDWIRQLALSAHLGQPMVGIWDWAGMTACVVIAVGGLLLGAWGIARRDVEK